ncbi:3-hydroxyacyl-CoA dehydrogenase [Arthrobacter sp. AL08]|uniref:3-hydroxyacyl-CoA dehydrogenase n=1 Tax=Micrococcaceae TaxID=1268 RepID=UPI001D001419|nr:MULTISPECIES: 3-hydroxyacyl-CoA dehydrogenase [Micrococcaceae]MCB5282466.1 3-hydroxybutyryl-CoA dehydrogenase [Arthrobacter sp. ES1]MDI3242284.1 3-hydroxyacyl-CoA dehydrogenase [Arthrobacter sp. AL05]MDI3278294.1 3-hydroxyacyl-CoA dehydrogenase [Arthrobacter sp. AL08]MDJ0351564.1 3-hydroxyacyl-CoA dehydrogenase [Pseudarthrobacter sp. PH31-O2]WGZ78077.1 3-hydroxyacyl-CoA dehydrogenase [Arthrobacter sp. EM1]
MPDIKTLTVLGTGVLGSQIAYQAAFHGFEVTAYDIDDAALEKARARFDHLAGIYREQTVAGAVAGKAEAALGNLHLTADLGAAVANADLVIEAVPEMLELKRNLYRKLADLAPAKTIFATNSSTLLPSDLKDSTGRPDRFLAIHYANNIWTQNIAEVMGTADTDPAVFDAVVGFARNSGLEPIEIKKEKAGYVLNSLLVPLLNAAAGLLLQGVASPETIDKTWRIATGAPSGPFQIYDVVGLGTAYNIASSSADAGSQAFARYLKESYIDKGKLGVATGEGFYKY